MTFERVEIGDAVLYRGDSLQILPCISGVDSVISDPPYGIALSNHGAGKARRAADYTIAGDKSQDDGIAVQKWAEERSLPVVFFASPRLPWPGEWRNWLVWDKGGAVGGGGDIATCWKLTWELIQVARNGALDGKRDESILRFPMLPTDSALHPAQKPVALMQYLISKIKARRPIDPFMGSGSTGVAAILLGRGFVGIEKDPRHFETACRRIEEAKRQQTLFEPAPVMQQEALL